MGRSGPIIVNLLTLMMLGATALVSLTFLLILLNPALPINPFPPRPLPPIAVLPSPTPTSLVPTLPHTFTPTFTPTHTQSLPTATFTPEGEVTVTVEVTVEETTPAPDITETATETETPTLTPTATSSGPTPTPTKTRSAFPFTVQVNGPIPVQNFANGAGCNWMGIAGQAFDLNGIPIVGYIVHLEGGGLEADSFTGSKTAYGAGGYEFFLNDHVVQTTGEYKVQLLNPSGTPISDFVVVNTFADCSKNLLLVNFVQNH
jgi:hypothetical protein